MDNCSQMSNFNRDGNYRKKIKWKCQKMKNMESQKKKKER